MWSGIMVAFECEALLRTREVDVPVSLVGLTFLLCQRDACIAGIVAHEMWGSWFV